MKREHRKEKETLSIILKKKIVMIYSKYFHLNIS